MVLKTEDVRERTTTTEIPTKTEYRIIVENCTIRLSERVNEMLFEGWDLQGGVSGHTCLRPQNRGGSAITHEQMWAQAMIKKQ